MSGRPIEGRTTAAGEEEVVVFLIGMRVNSFAAPRSWLPVARAMGPMIAELSREKGSGLLGY
ncbi:monooxygenase family protein, partial [Streptomyces sp. NPDC058855]